MPVSTRRPLVAWNNHVTKWKDCQLCPLSGQRDKICLARGTVPCGILFIGEAPGASEDALGQPFAGPAGKVLDQIIERSLPTIITYALTNLVACFPREAKLLGDNEPTHKEILTCRPRLYEFINIARPKLIVCVGKLATAYVDHDNGVQCIDIVHPAHILRMPLVQRQMAVQKSIVVLRNAVDNMVNSDCPNFTNWGYEHAGNTSKSHSLYPSDNIPY